MNDKIDNLKNRVEKAFDAYDLKPMELLTGAPGTDIPRAVKTVSAFLNPKLADASAEQLVQAKNGEGTSERKWSEDPAIVDRTQGDIHR